MTLAAAEQFTTRWIIWTYHEQVSLSGPIPSQEKNIPKKARKAFALLKDIPDDMIKELEGITPWDVKKLTLPEAKELNRVFIGMLCNRCPN